MNILITGKPGIGKTTFIKKLIKEIERPKAGFFTQEIRKGGKRTGFLLKTLEGNEAILADVSINSPHRVGKYKVDVEAFEKVGVESLKKALLEKKLIIIDEIGKMELCSEKFKEALLEALDEKRTIATIKTGTGGLIGKIKKRDDVKIINLERDDTDTALDYIRKIIPAPSKKKET